MENIIKVNGKTLIFNGGNPLPGCPTNWDEANKWQEVANENKEEFGEPRWKFDCGYKLDFDGPLIDVSGRFYPPKTHYGPKWDGEIEISIMGVKIETKEIEVNTLDELKAEAERYIESLVKKIKRIWND